MAMGDRIFTTPQPTIAGKFDPTLIYKKGDIVYYQNILYTRNLTATAASAWDATKWDLIKSTEGFVKLYEDKTSLQEMNGGLTFHTKGVSAINVDMDSAADTLIKAGVKSFGPLTILESDGTFSGLNFSFTNWLLYFNNDTYALPDSKYLDYVTVTLNNDSIQTPYSTTTQLTDVLTSLKVTLRYWYAYISGQQSQLLGYLYKDVKLSNGTYKKGWYCGKKKDVDVYTKKAIIKVDAISLIDIGKNNVIIGRGSDFAIPSAMSYASVILGMKNHGSYQNQVIIGNGSKFEDNGYNNENSTMIGYNLKVEKSDSSFVAGLNSTISGRGSNHVVIGNSNNINTDATGTISNNIMIGSYNNIKGYYDTAIGTNITVKNYNLTSFQDVKYSMALGYSANVYNDLAVAIGQYSKVEKGGSLAVGKYAAAHFQHSIAIGKNVDAGYKEFVIGNERSGMTSKRNIGTKWVSGNNYTKDQVVYSVLNPASNEYGVYKAKNDITGSTTYPSMDSTNWQNLSSDNIEYPYTFAVHLPNRGEVFAVDENGQANIYLSLNTGYNNTIESKVYPNGIVGYTNQIIEDSCYSFITGTSNTIKNHSRSSFISGANNSIDHCEQTFVAGEQNTLSLFSNYSIALGRSNYLNKYSHMVSAIGAYNNVCENSDGSAIIGYQNKIESSITSQIMTSYIFGANNKVIDGGKMAIGNQILAYNTGAYAFGDNIITKGTNLCIGYNFSADAPHALWDTTATYNIGDIVEYNYKHYISKTDNNTGNQPDTSSANWSSMSITDARIDKHVIIGLDSKKVLDADHNGNVTVYKQVYFNAADGKRTAAALEEIGDQFDDTKAYAVGDLVIYNNYLYKANVAHAAGDGWIAANWTKTNIVNELGNGGSSVIIDGVTGKKYVAIVDNGVFGIKEVG